MAAFGCAAQQKSPLGKPRLNDGVFYPKVLLGTRRQFADDSMLSLEYLYQADGYTAQQFQDYVNAARPVEAGARARAAGERIPGASTFFQPPASADGVPQRFSFDPRAQHYLFVTYQKPRINDDFTAQLVLIAEPAGPLDAVGRRRSPGRRRTG